MKSALHSKIKLFSLSFLLSTFTVNAQFTNIVIDSITYPNEPSIMMNPKNTNELVAGANFDNVYYSTDGGLTWTNNTINSAYGIWGDPCIAVDTSGDFYFFHLSNSQGGGFGSPGWLDRIVCQKSLDGGATWSSGTYTGYTAGPNDHDKQWSAVDFTGTSPYQNTIYLTWTKFDEYGSSAPGDSSRILFSKSTDGSATWDSVITISQYSGDCIDEDNTTEGAVPAVGPNGEVYVAWSFNSILYFDRSTDGGQTWLANDIQVATQPAGWDYSIPGLQRCNGLPITACDISGGATNGNIYVNWSDQRNGTTDTDIWLARSTDNGNTWTPPIRVNDDAPGNHNFMSWMTIDQTNGYIYVVFYDRRNYTNTQTDVYVAYSTDGGNTFTNLKVSNSPFVPTSGTFFGDYVNIIAHNGHVRPIWTRLSSGKSSVWTAIMDFATGVESAGNFSLGTQLQQNYPNPFFDQTVISFNSVMKQNLTLEIYDLTGKKMTQLFSNKSFENGSHRIVFDKEKYHLAPGSYFIKLYTDRFSETKKMMLME